MVSLDGVYMGANVWRQDNLLVLLFYSGVPNEHVKQAHSKTLAQLSTFIIVPQVSIGFTADNVEGRKVLWHHLMLLKWQCYNNVVSNCKLLPTSLADLIPS